MIDPKHKRRLAAVLAADAVGYSRQMSRDDQATVAALDAARSIFRHHINANQGRVIDMAGDSVLAVFDTAAGAVTAGVDTQAALLSETTGDPENRLAFRVGVHLGDLIEKDDGTIYGDGVNIAARLESLTEPGTVLVSDIVYGAVRGRQDTEFEDAGEHQVKNIERPVRAYRARHASDVRNVPRTRPTSRFSWRALVVGLAVLASITVSAFWFASDPSSLTTKPTNQQLPEGPTVAVLKFRNLNSDAESAHIGPGFAEDLINELARNRDFSVVSRHSGFSIGQSGLTSQEIAQKLGARYLVDGRVGVDAGKLRVNLSMTDGKAGRVIWTTKALSSAQELDATREDIVNRIAGTLRTNLKDFEKRQVMRRKTDNLDVYTLSMAVLARKHTFLPDAYRLARQEGKRAIELDPEYAPAWVYLAYLNMVDTFARVTGEWPMERLHEVESLLAQGMKLDPEFPIAFQVLSQIRGAQGRKEEALKAAKEAVFLAPNDADGLLFLAMAHMSNGQIAESIAALEKSAKLFPIPPIYFYGLGAEVLWSASDYKKVLAYTNDCLRHSNRLRSCWVENIVALVETNQLAEAEQMRIAMLQHHAEPSLVEMTRQFAAIPELLKRRESVYRRARFGSGVPK